MAIFHSRHLLFSLVGCWLLLLLAACSSPAVDSAPASAQFAITRLQGSSPAPCCGQANQVYALAWSPDGKHLATGEKNGKIQVWSTTMHAPLITCQRSSGEVYAVAWSPDGKRLASGGMDTSIQIWDAETGKQLFTYRSFLSRGEVLAVAWSPDGKYLASGSNDGIANTGVGLQQFQWRR